MWIMKTEDGVDIEVVRDEHTHKLRIDMYDWADMERLVLILEHHEAAWVARAILANNKEE